MKDHQTQAMELVELRRQGLILAIDQYLEHPAQIHVLRSVYALYINAVKIFHKTKV